MDDENGMEVGEIRPVELEDMLITDDQPYLLLRIDNYELVIESLRAGISVPVEMTLQLGGWGDHEEANDIIPQVLQEVYLNF